MKKILIGIIIILLSISSTNIVADWDIGDGHKMHHPQTPKMGGWDVEFSASELADDWNCSHTGPVEEIHFWISWMENMVQTISNFRVNIYSDLPADDPSNPYGYSVPYELLWYRDFESGDFVIRSMPLDDQGWFNPSTGDYNPNDHQIWHQINIPNITSPFTQIKGEIYWLGVDFGMLPFIGWKETQDNWNDAGVWLDKATSEWRELSDPIHTTRIDLAFVINGTKTVIFRPIPEPFSIFNVYFDVEELLGLSHTDIPWEMTISGAMFPSDPVTFSGTIPSIQQGQTVQIKSGFLFGIGPLSVELIIGESDPQTFSGIILFIFILMQ
jgi:hypothetical protein